MESVPRGSDGRRLFSPEFKREQVARLVRGELTISELSRELGISRSVLQRWKHLIAQGGEIAVARWQYWTHQMRPRRNMLPKLVT